MSLSGGLVMVLMVLAMRSKSDGECLGDVILLTKWTWSYPGDAVCVTRFQGEQARGWRNAYTIWYTVILKLVFVDSVHHCQSR